MCSQHSLQTHLFQKVKIHPYGGGKLCLQWQMLAKTKFLVHYEESARKLARDFRTNFIVRVLYTHAQKLWVDNPGRCSFCWSWPWTVQRIPNFEGGEAGTTKLFKIKVSTKRTARRHWFPFAPLLRHLRETFRDFENNKTPSEISNLRWSVW